MRKIGYIFILALCTMFYLFQTMEQDMFIESVHDFVNENKKSAPISSFTSFQWEGVCLLPPYSVTPHTDHDRVAALLGKRVKNFDQVPVLDSDGEWGIVFFDKDIIIKKYVISGVKFLSRSPSCVDRSGFFLKSNEGIFIKKGVVQ